jgi:hypothetical protein
MNRSRQEIKDYHAGFNDALVILKLAFEYNSWERALNCFDLFSKSKTIMKNIEHIKKLIEFTKKEV